MIIKINKSILLTLTFFISSCFLTVFAQQSEIYKYSNGEGIKIVNDAGYLIKIKTYVQPSFESRWNTDSTSEKYYNRFRVRRLRLRFDGSDQYNKWNYRLQFNFGGVSEIGDSENSEIALLDAFVRYNFERRFQLTIGQRSLMASDNRELTIASTSLQLPERSRLTSSFSSIRDFGLFLRKDIRFRNLSRLRNYFEITTGDGKNNMLTKNYGGLKYGARIDFLPFGTFTNKGQFRTIDIMRENSLKLVVGINCSYNNGISSRRGRVGGDFLFYNISETDTSYRLPNYLKYGGDMLLKYRGFSVLAEYVNTKAYIADDITHRNDRYGDDPSEIVSNFINEYTTQEYVKRQLILGSGFNIQSGYLFKNLWSVDARFTSIKSDELSWLNNEKFFDRPKYYTLGVSKMFNKSYSYKIQASITLVELDEDGLTKDFDDNRISGQEIYFRLITTIAF